MAQIPNRAILISLDIKGMFNWFDEENGGTA
jgi:hypothetical protein